MKINDLATEAHQRSVDKGWWDDEGDSNLHIYLAAKAALIGTEVSECIEAIRDDELETHWLNGKPEGLPIELADVVIRVCDLAARLRIDLEAAIREKMDYNRTRTHRHGGRKL